MYLFLYLFISPSGCRAPSCGLSFDPAVSSMAIVFPLLTGIGRNIKCIRNRSIYTDFKRYVPWSYMYFLNKRLYLPLRRGIVENFAHSLFFLSTLPKPISYCAGIYDYYILPGCIWMLLWVTRAGWSELCSGCRLETRGGCTVNLWAARCYTATSLSLLLSLLHTSTFTSLLCVCQHFPSGGVRHGVRVPGLPASASSHCDLQPRHLSSTCQCRSRSLPGVYTELTPRARRGVFSCAHRDGKSEHSLSCQRQIDLISFYRDTGNFSVIDIHDLSIESIPITLRIGKK